MRISDWSSDVCSSDLNLLCGRAGMLSFGHAAYFGVGAFATVHAMNAIGGAGLLPTPLMPLAGAIGGLIFGGIAGWFATQRSGTYFAMITLAIAEPTGRPSVRERVGSTV